MDDRRGGSERHAVLGRLVHGAACFGALPDELARLAAGRADVIRAALVLDQLDSDGRDADESPVSRTEVLRVLRTTLRMLEDQ